METKVIKINNIPELLMALFDEFNNQLNKVDTTELCKPHNEDELTLKFYINRLARKLQWHPNKVANRLNSIAKLYPVAAFSILLREIALQFDEHYEDHIRNCKEVYTISIINGKIYKVNASAIKNFNNFAAFRTVDEAKTACKILENYLNIMF